MSDCIPAGGFPISNTSLSFSGTFSISFAVLLVVCFFAFSFIHFDLNEVVLRNSRNTTPICMNHFFLSFPICSIVSSMFFLFTCSGVSSIVIPVAPYSTSVVGRVAFGVFPPAYFRKLPSSLLFVYCVSLRRIFFFMSIACFRRRRLSHVLSVSLSFFCIFQFHLSHMLFGADTGGHLFSSP